MPKIEVFQVEDSVPIPVRVEPIPLRTMEVGQSVKFPIAMRPKVQTYCSRLKKETGKEFVVSKIDDESCRVWRSK